MSHDDRVLSLLAHDLTERRIFRVEMREEPFSEEEVSTLQQQVADACGVSFDDADYLISVNTIQKDMYDPEDDQIDILMKRNEEGKEWNEIKDIAEASELFNISLLSKKIRKYYLCYQRI